VGRELAALIGILVLLSSPLYQVNAAMQPLDPIPDPVDPAADNPAAEVEQAFAETDALIDQLRQQYAQVQATRRRVAQKAAQAEDDSLQEGQADRIKAKLEELELNLAFTILSSLGDAARERLEEISQQESFWQFVRFAGLGFILGLVIKGITG
jgi:vacuolar-type H+-ATPase subunit E/Vma4